MIVHVRHNPELTVDSCINIFDGQFGNRYKIVRTPRMLRRDFQIEKNPWVCVGVHLQQEPNQTSFVFSGFTPSFWRRILVSGLLSLLFYNGLTNEVKRFIKQAPEFH